MVKLKKKHIKMDIIIMGERDAIVKVTLASICSSDLHIKNGSVPRAVKGITVGHEMVGVVEAVGTDVSHVKPGDRVTVNVETFCGECFFCKKGFVNNCTDQNGGWHLDAVSMVVRQNMCVYLLRIRDLTKFRKVLRIGRLCW